MRQIRCKQHTAHGLSEIYVRFINSLIFIKFQKWGPEAEQMVQTLENAGAKIEKGESNWIKVNIFGENNFAKIGDVVIDIKEDQVDKIEGRLCEFFTKKYKDAKYTVEDLSGI